MLQSLKELFKQPLLVFAICAGIILRLAWTTDMEWKEDEKDMYRMACDTSQGLFRAAGMFSGGGLVNPGFSVTPFILFAAVSKDPVMMTRFVQIVNVLALLGFLLFALTKIPANDRTYWLRGIALAAVSPLAVLFSRKLWAQDVLPIVSLIIIVSHYHRSRKFPAFVWGLSGAMLGQIHMSGFFYSAGLFLYTLYVERAQPAKTRWLFWIAGSLVGCITLSQWFLYTLEHPQVARQDLWNLVRFNFFIHWVLDGAGLNIYYSLRGDFWDFMRGPRLMGIPTYLMVVAHLVLIVTAFPILSWTYKKVLLFFTAVRTRTLTLFFPRQSLPSDFYLYAMLIGLGVLLTLSAVLIQPHYMICAFPFQYIFIAKVLKDRKRLFEIALVTQLVITTCFMFYIHQNGGAPRGDYGVSYRLQDHP